MTRIGQTAKEMDVTIMSGSLTVGSMATITALSGNGIHGENLLAGQMRGEGRHWFVLNADVDLVSFLQIHLDTISSCLNEYSIIERRN